MSTPQEKLKRLLAEPLQEVDRKQEPLLTVLRNVQGNILHGHGRDFAAHIFLQFRGGKAEEVKQVKQLLREHIICKDTFKEQLAEKKVMSAQALLDERESNSRESLFVSCLVSASGYSYFLGETPQQFSQEFRDGMKNDRTRKRLSDPPYTSWGPYYKEEQEIHAMILLAHQNEGTLRKEKQKLVDAIKPLVERYWVEWGNVLRK